MTEPLLLVSGLPRCGTSLMMQMLEAGGIEPFTDRVRQADDDNPKGYFEWEAIKQIGRDHRILEPALGSGKAIKVISALLPKLPKAHHYKVIYMERDINEVVRSQNKMIAARGERQDSEALAQTVDRMRAHNEEIKGWMRSARHLDFITVSHRQLIRKTAKQLPRIIEFVGEELLPKHEAMPNSIELGLYRNRNHSRWRDRLGF